jgi:hypothetical protein
MPIPKPSPGRGGSRAPAAVSLLNLIIPSTAKLVSSQPLTRRPSPRSKCGQRARVGAMTLWTLLQVSQLRSNLHPKPLSHAACSVSTTVAACRHR